MKRTQVQIPDPLYREIPRVAELKEWSVSEVLRRGAEYMVRCFPGSKISDQDWEPPEALPLGEFLAPVEEWRSLANDRGVD